MKKKFHLSFIPADKTRDSTVPPSAPYPEYQDDTADDGAPEQTENGEGFYETDDQAGWASVQEENFYASSWGSWL